MNGSITNWSWYLCQVTIERFKAAFKPGPIPLRPFNVVIGRNGSGKSTLIEALQWLDTTMRLDARKASDRYYGLRHLTNLRSQLDPLHFRIGCEWSDEEDLPRFRYHVKVEERSGTPFVAEEKLVTLRKSRYQDRIYLRTTKPGVRLVYPKGARVKRKPPPTPGIQLTRKLPRKPPERFAEPERLAAAWASTGALTRGVSPFAWIREFWSRAVFLRLSPNRLSQGYYSTRQSFEPLLNEEGESLPALLKELTNDQKHDLVESIKDILPGIEDLEVDDAENGGDARVNYSLVERMPYKGRSGSGQFAIPAWMLSEGTRRIVAILALLVLEPAPTLLCIEEIENGLDPWSIISVLRHLQSAAERGTQVIVTTHSPWLLDHVPLEAILQVRRDRGDTKYEPFLSRKEIAGFSSSVPPGTRYVHEAE
jgi:predicted ATPase